MAAQHAKTNPVWAVQVLTGIVALVFIVLAFMLPGLVRLMIIGALVAYLLDPVVQYFERLGLSRTVAATMTFAPLLLIVFILLISLVPAAVDQLEALSTLDVNAATEYIESVDEEVDGWMRRLGMEEVNLVESVRTYLTRRLPDVLGFLPDALSFLVNLVFLPFIIFFLLKDGRTLKKGCISMMPNRYFEFTTGLLYKMDRQLGNYLRGQLIEATVVGLLSIAALWVLGVPYYLPIGLFAGLANIVPYLGPLAGSVVAVIISLLSGGSLTDAALIVVLFGLIQALDNNLIQPLVIARNIQMHPLVVAIVVIAGGQIFGFLGLLLAVPVAAICKVFVVESYEYLRRYRMIPH